jgi:hypothetical protein
VFKRGTLVVVIALALLSLVSASAYNTAVVTSSASFTVKSTDQAKLALIPKATTVTGNKDSAATVSAGGLLVLDFGNLQPNSVYIWTDLFKVKNNSPETLNVNLTSTGSSLLYFSTDSGSTWTQGSVSSNGVGTTAEVQISVKLQVPSSEALGAVTASIVVTGTAQ